MLTSKLIAMLVLMVSSAGASTPSLDGVWRSEGWGSVYEIHGKSLRSFEVTSKTCVAGFSAEQISDGIVSNRAAFRSNKRELFYVLAGRDDGHKRLQHPTGLTSITLARISALPDACRPPTANTPLGNFDVFAQTFSEHYIAFDLRHID